ncbi:MAG: hypothetical protein KJZ87_19755 [Thermoguttaceae bacterium]|nr:hypothetical protein [Thermoguttaceae bacterium]
MERTGFNVKDASLVRSVALPNGANTVYSDGIDLGALSGRGARLYEAELLIEAPALVTADLGDGATMKYSIQTDDDAAFGSPTVVAADVIVQTGAGGAGAAAQTYRWRIPTGCERHVRVRAVNSAAGDASDKSMTVSLCF